MTDTLAPRESQQRPASVKRKRSRLGTAMFIVLLVALGLVATGVLPVRDFLGRESAVNAARDELASITEENTRLNEDVNALYSQAEIERIAREQYGFVRPGEIGYVAVLPDRPVADTNGATAEPVAHDDRSLLQMIWDFITGNDIAGDG